jgi:D-proline reductase (dithiol) PrdB
MASIEYVTCLNEGYQSQGFPPYKWSVYDSAPFVELTKPLNQSKVSIISSGGIFREGQEPFNGWAVNDYSLRLIPMDTPFNQLRLNHNYFDHRDAVKDYNCVLPIQRVRELAEEGFIGEAAHLAVSLGMGRTYKRSGIFQQTIPAVVSALQKQEVDAALLVAA